MALLVTLALAAVASPASGTPDGVRAGSTVAGCRPDPPQLVFPHSSPFRRSGPGALLWDGAASRGECAGEASSSTVLLAPILPSDGLGSPRRLAGAAGGPVLTAATTQGQVLTATRIAGVGGKPIAAVTEGRADGTLSLPRPLDGALGPLAVDTGYLGDVGLAWVRGTASRPSIALAMQRHFARAPALQGHYPIGAGAVSAVDLALDYRSDALLTWAQSGHVRARFVSASGGPGPIQSLGSSAASPALASVLSDDGRAIVAWVSQHPSTPTGPATAYVYVSISAPRMRFSAPRLLERFREPSISPLPSTSVALVRLSTESVTMAWTGLGGDGHYVVRSAPIGLGGPGGVTTLSDPASDALLGGLAAGPRADAVAVWTVPAPGATSVVARLLVPSFAHDRLGAPVTVAGPGPHSDPVAALDPDTDRALVAWRAEDQPWGLGLTTLAPLGAPPGPAVAVH